MKENQTMYKMLLTLLPQIETDRDDLRIIRDNLFKLNARVTEKWGKWSYIYVCTYSSIFKSCWAQMKKLEDYVKTR